MIDCDSCTLPYKLSNLLHCCWPPAAMSQARSSRADTSGGEPGSACSKQTAANHQGRHTAQHSMDLVVSAVNWPGLVVSDEPPARLSGLMAKTYTPKVPSCVFPSGVRVVKHIQNR